MGTKKFTIVVAVLFFLTLVSSFVLSSTFVEDDFSTGTLLGIEEDASGFLKLSAGNYYGSYLSFVLNVTPTIAFWDSLQLATNSWGELPNNQQNASAYIDDEIDMTGNVLLMHFNKDSAYGENDLTVHDFSGNGHTGTVYGDADELVDLGKFGGSLELDGFNDYVDVGVLPINTFSELTVAGWLKFEDYSALKIALSITHLGSDDIRIFTNSNTLIFALDDGATASLISAPLSSADNNRWIFFAGTFDGSIQKFYVDGSLIGTVPDSYNFATANGHTYLGSRNGVGYFWGGGLDELAIWNRTLSGDEILSLYRRGLKRMNVQARTCDTADCSDISGWDYESHENKRFLHTNGVDSYYAEPSTVSEVVNSFEFGFYTPQTISSATSYIAFGDLGVNSLDAMFFGSWSSQITSETFSFYYHTTGGTTYIRDAIPAGFHTFRLVWDVSESKYDWYMDGAELMTYADSSNGHFPQLTSRKFTIGKRSSAYGETYVSYFNVNEQPIFTALNNSHLTKVNTVDVLEISGASFENQTLDIDDTKKYVQYKVEFATYNPALTPELYNVSLLYYQPPSVELTSPVDSGTVGSSTTFSCTATDTDLKNISLYHNATGSFIEEDSSSSVTSGVAKEFSQTFSEDATVIWNCYACDDTGLCSWATENKTVTIDATAPTLEFGSGVPENGTYTTSSQLNLSSRTYENNLSYSFLLQNSSGEVSSTFEEVIPQGLLAWWSFDGDATDRTGLYNGTVYGDGDEFVESGKFNGAIELDGTADYMIPSSIPATSSISISAWISPARTFSTYGGQIVARGDNLWSFALENDNLFFGEFAWAQSGNNQIRSSSFSYDLDGWQHVAVVYDDATKTADFYFNGNAVGLDRSSVSSPGLGTTSDIYVGARLSGFYFEGLLDEVSIWNKTLSSEEISQLNSSAYATVYQDELTLPDGVYNFTVSANDSVNNSAELFSTFTVDTTYPTVSFSGLTPDNDSGSKDNVTIQAAITETNFDVVELLWNNTRTNYSLVDDEVYNVSQDTYVFNITLEGLVVGEAYNYSLTVYDLAGLSNATEERVVYGNSNPVLSSIVTSPNDSNDVDPNETITFYLNVTDVDENFANATLFYRSNETGVWENKIFTGTNISTTQWNLQANFTPPYTTDLGFTYDYYVDAVDTASGSANSTIVSLPINWDCTWTVNESAGVFIGWNENKDITNITLTNTGDSQYPVHGCELSLRLDHDYGSEKICADNWCYMPTSPYELLPGNSTLVELQAYFGSAVAEETLTVETRELFGRSNTSSQNTSVVLISNEEGPYLYQEITQSPSLVYLQSGQTFDLNAYVRNMMGRADVDEEFIAFNVTSSWNASSIFSLNQTSQFFDNLTLATPAYVPIEVSVVDVASFEPDSYNFTFSSYGYDNASDIIISGDDSILHSSVAVTFACYTESDGVCVSACGYPTDPDCTPVTVTEEVPGGGSGGGSGAGASSGGFGATSEQLDALFQTNETFVVVRGKGASFDLVVENPFESPLQNVSLVLNGFLNQYLKINAPNANQILPGNSLTYEIVLDAPDYFESAVYDLEFLINGFIDESTYNESYTITRLTQMQESRFVKLYVVEYSQEEAYEYYDEAIELLGEMDVMNYSVDSYSSFLSQASLYFSNKEFTQIKEFYDLVKADYDALFETLELHEVLVSKLADASYRGLDVPETHRLFALSQAALERGDYQTAVQRARDARFNLALETVGVFNVVRFVVNNWWQVLVGLAAFVLLVYFIVLLVRRAYYSYRLKSSLEEKKILLGLMKQVQHECFSEGKLSMEEYTQNMVSYEQRLNTVISNLINFTNKKHNLFRFWIGSYSRLLSEKRQLLDLIRDNQKQYLRTNTLETRVYQNRMKSYSSRLGEIEEKLAFVEAKRRLRKRK